MYFIQNILIKITFKDDEYEITLQTDIIYVVGLV